MRAKKVSYDKFFENWIPRRYLLEPQKPEYSVKKLKEVVAINPKSSSLNKNFLKPSDKVKVIEISSVDKIGKVVEPKVSNLEDISSKVRFRAHKNEVLVPVIQVGKFTPALVPEDGMLVSDNYAVLIPQKANPYYLIWALSTDYVKKQIKARSRGSLVYRIPYSELEEIEIPWLNETERNRKVTIIKEKFDELTPEELALKYQEKINTVMEKYFQYNSASLKDKLVGRIPYNSLYRNQEWKVDTFLSKEIEQIINVSDDIQILKLDKITTHIGMGVNLYKSKGGDKTVRVIRSKNMNVLTINGPYDEKIINQRKLKEIKPGDSLMQRKGGIGPAAIITKELANSTYDDTLVRIVVDNSKVIPDYLAIYLNSNLSQYLLDSYTVEKSMKYIKVSDLKKVKIALPTIEQQKMIITEVYENNY